MKQRVAWIDVAKGICMISVVLGHLGVSQFGFVYSYHLTTFFILSGYTMKREELTGAYLKNKFLRLMSPYFITCAAVIVMEIVNEIVIQRSFSTTSITKLVYIDIVRCFFASGTHQSMGNIEMGRFIGAIWFLPAMFFALVTAQVLLNLIETWKLRWAVGLFVAAIGCITSKIIWFPFSIQAGMFAVLFLLLGFWIREINLLDKLRLPHYLCCGIVFLGGCLIGYAQVFYMVTCTMKDWLVTPLCAICSSLLVIGISRVIKCCPPLEFIGKNSLIFLCVHLFEMNTLSRYYAYARKIMGIPEYRIIHLVMEIVLICTISFVIVRWNMRKCKTTSILEKEKRDSTVDIMRALLIVMMIVGHVRIDSGLSRLIYSCHMMAFVMISGYFYKSELPCCNKLKKTIKALIPYAVYLVLYIITNHGGIFQEVKTGVMGISFTNKVLTSFASVGPVYFILLLVATRLIYVVVDEIENEYLKDAIILALFLIGIFLGKNGIWLFWSLDCALFSLLFYHIAYYMRKYHVLEFCKENPYLYFVLSCIWAFMIHNGAMEVALRKYGNIGLTILGVISAFILLYLLCSYLSVHMIRPLRILGSWIGQGTAYILIIHTLFGTQIGNFVKDTLQLNPQNIFYLAVVVIIQIMLGTLIQFIIQKTKSTILN